MDLQCCWWANCSLCCFIIYTSQPIGCGICMEWPALPSSYANRHWHFQLIANPPQPFWADQKNHQTLATIKSIKWSNNPPWDINNMQLLTSIGCVVDLISWGRFCHLKRFDSQVLFVCERLPRSSSAHLSLLSSFLQSSIHLSVHSSFHPSAGVAFVPRLDPSVIASTKPRGCI